MNKFLFISVIHIDIHILSYLILSWEDRAGLTLLVKKERRVGFIALKLKHTANRAHRMRSLANNIFNQLGYTRSIKQIIYLTKQTSI